MAGPTERPLVFDNKRITWETAIGEEKYLRRPEGSTRVCVSVCASMRVAVV